LKTKLKMATGWIHTTLIFSLFFPTLYSLGMETISGEQIWLYILNLLLIIPVIATEISILCCKSLIRYLFFSILSILATEWIIFTIDNICSFQSFDPAFIAAVIMIEGIYIIIYRFLGRLHNKKMEMTYADAEESKERYDMLTNPGFTGMLFFFVSYMIGIFFNNELLCNEAFFSCIFYFFTAMLYLYLKNTENYLFINQTIENVPKKRIYGISKNIFLVLSFLLLLASIPSILTIPNRTYHNARELLSNTPYLDGLWEDTQTESSSEDDEFYKYLQEMVGEPLYLPWLEPLTKILMVLIFLIIGIYIIKYINKTQRTFREAYDENGDIIENLDMIDYSSFLEEKIARKKWDKKNMSPREKIRYDYYLFIKKHRHELPLPHETPYEIEKAANIADMEETKKIHLQYEQARYDK